MMVPSLIVIAASYAQNLWFSTYTNKFLKEHTLTVKYEITPLGLWLLPFQ